MGCHLLYSNALANFLGGGESPLRLLVEKSPPGSTQENVELDPGGASFIVRSAGSLAIRDAQLICPITALCDLRN